MAQIIVVGNEKGGAGKTTSAMHLIVSLLTLGYKVGTIDLDSRQQSLTRYIENRKKTAEKRNQQLLMPEHYAFEQKVLATREEEQKDEEARFREILDKLAASNDYIIIDTPGSDTHISRIAHLNADIVVTPINDSFVDLDLIGIISADTMDPIKPGIYSAMLWEQKMKRAMLKKGEIKWVIVRNRLSTLDAINKRNVETSLMKLSKRFGFKIAPGFGDRVVFKELFLLGLTLHDVINSNEIKLTPSVIAARQELRDFIQSLGIIDNSNSNSQEAIA
jgi:chromosome partitioning protein